MDPQKSLRGQVLKGLGEEEARRDSEEKRSSVREFEQGNQGYSRVGGSREDDGSEAGLEQEGLSRVLRPDGLGEGWPWKPCCLFLVVCLI